MGTVFSAYDIRGRIDDDSLSVNTAWNVGNAFGDWLQNDGNLVVVKAKSVIEEISRGVIEGILLQGRNVIDGGVGDANTVVELVKERQADGGVLVSHDDLQNLEIITLFSGTGNVITAEDGLNEINEIIESGNFLPAPQKGNLIS